MKLNPFSDNIVKKPRQIEHPVIGLNDSQLSEIENEFERLLANDEKSLSHAVFITSAQAGYGKSHLLGRLFRKLNARATLLYILPFQDPESCWKSILLRVVQELKFPDRVFDREENEESPTQLEIIAHGIIVDLTIKAIQNSPSPGNRAKIIAGLKKQTVQGMRESGQFKKVKERFPQIASLLNPLRIELNFNIISWLNVLGVLAYEPGSALRQGCEDWLKGASIDRQEARSIGIRQSDVIRFDAGSSEMNDHCQKRLEDLCGLMLPVRPFVFCFDDTERYLSSELAEKFALVVQMLVRDFQNHMTVVTANREPWEKIAAHWQEAQLNCLGRAVQLDGINKNQAEKLIRGRLDFWGLGGDKRQKTLSGQWFDQLFQDRGQRGIRFFLKSCEKRWDETHRMPSSDNLETHYLRTVERLKSEKRRQVFDRDALRWLVEEAALGLDGLTITPYKGQKPYLAIRWKKGDQVRYFGFEDGNHHLRWKAIMGEAKRHFKSTEKARSVFIRTPDLKKIPPDTWKIAQTLKNATEKFMPIIELDFYTICRLYAAKDIFQEAVTGDIGFDAEETRAYIQEKLSDFWELLWTVPKDKPIADTHPSGDPPAELTEKIMRIVKREKFMDYSELAALLEPKWTEESLIRGGIDKIQEIKQYHAPNMTVLKWL